MNGSYELIFLFVKRSKTIIQIANRFTYVLDIDEINEILKFLKFHNYIKKFYSGNYNYYEYKSIK